MALVLIACGENVKQHASIPSDIGYPGVISRGDVGLVPDHIAPSLRTER